MGRFTTVCYLINLPPESFGQTADSSSFWRARFPPSYDASLKESHMSSSIAKGTMDWIVITFASAKQRDYIALVPRGMVLVLADVFALGAADFGGLIAQRAFLNYFVGEPVALTGLGSPSPYAIVAFVNTLIFVLAVLALAGRYGGRLPFWSELRILFQTSLSGAVILAVVGALLSHPVGGEPMVATLVLFPAIATVTNRFSRRALVRCGHSSLNVLLIGEPIETAAMDAAFRSEPLLGYKVVRHIDPAALGPTVEGFPLGALIRLHRAQTAIATFDAGHPLLSPLIDTARRERLALSTVPVTSIVGNAAHASASFLSHDQMLMRVHQGQSRPIGPALKLSFDVVATALLLVLLCPLFLVISLLTGATGHPIFFAHRRIGRGGRSFNCLKFRTMRTDGDAVLARHLDENPLAAEEWATTRKLSHDPRITRLGHILRKASLDELPQLINVLMLDMSLVGPRPIVQSEVAKYGDMIGYYTAMRPGLTGLWQVSGRSNTSYARRVSLDVWYIKNWSFWSDIAVLLKTIPAVLMREGAH